MPEECSFFCHSTEMLRFSANGGLRPPYRTLCGSKKYITQICSRAGDPSLRSGRDEVLPSLFFDAEDFFDG